MWKTGRIEGFLGSWGSGVAFLVIDGQLIPCENTPTVRALDELFGDVIAPGHTVNLKAVVGRQVAYKVDGFGLLEGLAPTEMADELNEPEVEPEGEALE